MLTCICAFTDYRKTAVQPASSDRSGAHSRTHSSARLASFARTALLTLAVLGSLAASQAHAWALDDVAKLASQKAATPYLPPRKTTPTELATLGYDGYRDIRYNPEKNLWRTVTDAGLRAPGFEANFFHVGPHGDAVRINEITPEGVRPIAYNQALFNFGKNQLAPQTLQGLDYGGLRTFSNLNSPSVKDELVVFLGASYFRALGAGQRFGLSARGLAIDTAGAEREEFPRFTEFWLEKPQPGTEKLTLYALMDSERITGAYRFEVTPGEQTVTDVQARLFVRPADTSGTNKPITTLGIAPLSSMFFFGENQPRPGDFRPEVHDSDGLMIASNDGEWLWRPLNNPTSPMVTSFAMKGLKGFGLMQRDRDFARYEDLEARYELRPSAWITPTGDWGPGRVELLQFMTPDETHDNIAAYWVPDKLPQPGESINLRYQIAWQGKNQQRPPNGWVTQSRRGIGYSRLSAAEQAQRIEFVIDFAGPALDALPEGATVKAISSASANGRVLESIAYKNPVNGTWRMSLRVQRLNPAQPVELRAFLQHDNHTLSETWTNLITP